MYTIMLSLKSIHIHNYYVHMHNYSIYVHWYQFILLVIYVACTVAHMVVPNVHLQVLIDICICTQVISCSYTYVHT